MELIVFALLVLNAFLVGIFWIAIFLRMKHRDHCASYPLYAVRDRLVAAAVFNGVARDDPWLESLYSRVNALLIGAHYLAGPAKWPLAKYIGATMGEVSAGPDLPDTEPPEPIQGILPDLLDALEKVKKDHVGIALLQSAKKRADLHRRKEEASRLHASLSARSGPRLAAG